MKKTKILGILTCMMLLLLSSACNEPNLSIQPACTDRLDADIVLDFGYLGFCTKSHENSEQQMKVEINVDGLTFDDATTTIGTQYLQSYSFNTNNDKDQSLNESDRTFKIKLPQCGSYVVTVVVRGTDSSCFTCCNGSSQTISYTNSCGNSTTVSKKGAPRFRTVSTRINASINAPPPSRLTLKPTAETCSNCGC